MSTVTLDKLCEEAQEAITAYENARRQYADTVRLEMQAEAERALVKSDAIGRLMNETNPQSRDGKPHSASSAEAVVETDSEYKSYLVNQRNIVHAKLRAETAARSAHLKAELSIALVKAQAGVM